MNLLKQLLTVVAFGYLCYHIYTFGPGMFNVTVLVILVLSAVANYCRDGFKTCSLSAQVQAKPFYESLGYRAEGEEYLDEGCPHVMMRKVL